MTTKTPHTGPSFIKVREKGRRGWTFLARGGVSRLRVHALRFETAERARALIAENEGDNPGWDWRIVPAS